MPNSIPSSTEAIENEANQKSNPTSTVIVAFPIIIVWIPGQELPVITRKVPAKQASAAIGGFIGGKTTPKSMHDQ
jgi:hypothetical protein